jgi:prophage regulatory protein
MQSQPRTGSESSSNEQRRQPLHAAQIADALLTLKTASAISGLSEPTLYRKAASDPTFPKLIKMGTRCTRIRAGDLTAWLAAQAKKAA